MTPGQWDANSNLVRSWIGNASISVRIANKRESSPFPFNSPTIPVLPTDSCTWSPEEDKTPAT